MNKLLFSLPVSILLLAENALAHCPLCTVGAGAAAAGAAWFGISNIVIGIFLGAAALAMGLWISRLIKKKYFPYQKWAISVFSFATIILPVLPLMKGYSSVYISIAGDYGSILNRTYMINLFLVGSLIGALILLITPLISNRITQVRNKTVPYQGITLTFALLIIAAVIAEVIA
jgi:hypothetical protein